ncbi:MAG: hypothetical protein KBT20_01270 [Bacteroidales bacterium]|nr:hypothetical protein [Candidatus Liminaster caballi]
MEDVSLEKVKRAAENGTLESLAKKVPEDQVALFLGLLLVAGIGYTTIMAIKEMVLASNK